MTQSRVTDDQYGQLWRRLEEVARRVREGTLSFPETMTAVQSVVEGKVQLQLAHIKYDKTKDGWRRLEDAHFNGQPFIPNIVKFLKPGEFHLSVADIRQRFKKLNANLGQNHAEYLLIHQNLIPEEWRKNNYCLIFPGTVWEDCENRTLIPSLSLVCDHWDLGFIVIDFDWDGWVVGPFRLVRVSK